VNDRAPFSNAPSQNRAVGPPANQRTFARASSAQSAFNVSSKGGKLVPGVTVVKTRRNGHSSTPTVRATGPPWLYAYVLLDRKSYELNEHFQLSIRALDRASKRQIHFQDIGNPRIHGEHYQHVRSPELATRDEREADIYEQEVTRLGGEWHKRLVETEQLANLLGIDHGDLPCIAFRTSPYTIAIPLRIKEAWFGSRTAGWSFIETLESWLSQGITWTPLHSSPTVNAVLDPLSDELSGLSSRINQAVEIAEQKHKSLALEAGKNVINIRKGFWRIRFAGETIIIKRSGGAAYLAILLLNRGKGFLPITLRNVACPPDFASEDDEPDEPGGNSGVDDGVSELYKSEINRFKPDPNHRLMNDEAIDAIIKEFERQAVVDGKTIYAIEAKRQSLKEQVNSAKAQEDFDRAQELDKKCAELEKIRRRMRGRSGRIRTFSDKERRANQSVPLAIRRTLKLIAESHPQLHLHLTNSIDYVPELCYNPETPTTWTSDLS